MGNWSIFGIGPVEAIFIVILMLIILGPRDMVATGRKLGRAISRIRRSPTWKLISNTSQAIRNLPDTLASEAGIEELQRELLRGTESAKAFGREISDLGSIDPRAGDHGEKTDPTEPVEGDQAEPAGQRAAAGNPPPTGQEPPFAAWTTPPAGDSADRPGGGRPSESPVRDTPSTETTE